MRLKILAAASFAVALAACGKPAEQTTPPPTTQQPTGPTYWKDVSPIVDAKCATCHMAGGIAPFTFDHYDTVKAMAPAIAQEVKAKRMPPWPPAKGCNEFVDDRSLTDAEIKTITDWNDGGAVEGDPAEKPAPQSQQQKVELGTPTLTIHSAAPYTSASKDSDDYRCFVVDPKLAQDAFVVASGVRPGNNKIVHHVILYEAPAKELAKVQQLDDAEPGEGYTCFGGPGFGNTAWITSWAPGAQAGPYPEGTGVRIRAGSKLVIQVHYNLNNARGEADQSNVDLWFANKPVKEAFIVPVPQLLLSISKGEKNAVVDFAYQLDNSDYAGLIYGAGGHMHLLGKKFSMSIKHADGREECVLNLPNYDFHWQGMYTYTKPLSIDVGDTLKMTCVYDNSQEAQPYINGTQQQSKDVTWGEKTTDEMCLGLLYVIGK